WAGVALTPETAAKPEPHAMYTFIPAADYLMQQLPALYPDAEIVFMLNDIIDGPVRDAILDICARRGIRCLELKDISKRMGHPDSAGMRAIATQLTEFLAQ
ncbi:MAG: SGNH/GDSL hydrolase family protein, partial [Muribaculaceae bacterium]|nr:SGNH/GDSL hydrolase family protein [Muribaculaceae bacterium]